MNHANAKSAIKTLESRDKAGNIQTVGESDPITPAIGKVIDDPVAKVPKGKNFKTRIHAGKRVSESR